MSEPFFPICSNYLCYFFGKDSLPEDRRREIIHFCITHPLPKEVPDDVPNIDGEPVFWAMCKCVEEWIAKSPDTEERNCLRALSYADYLGTAHWHFVRRRTLKQAGYRCQLCNAQVKLDVHHKTYERLGDEDPDDTIAICRKCHRRHHRVLPRPSTEKNP